jgi:hypothetical protein
MISLHDKRMGRVVKVQRPNHLDDPHVHHPYLASSLPSSLPFSHRYSYRIETELSNQIHNMVRTKSSSSDIDIDIDDIKPSTTSKTAKGNGAKWSGEDRRLLFVYVEKYGAGNWTAAANLVPGKTSKQVRVDVLSGFWRQRLTLFSVEISGCTSFDVIRVLADV